jgi:hypothetical protein
MTMSHAEQAYQHADKAIAHYQRLLAGRGLTRADQRTARLCLIRMVFARAAALDRMESEVMELAM